MSDHSTASTLGQINYTFDGLDNELEIRFQSIENQLDKMVDSYCSGIFKSFVLNNNFILKSQVGLVDVFGGEFLNFKSVWFGKQESKHNDLIVMEFPQLLPVEALIPESDIYKTVGIRLSCCIFRNGVLYCSGFSTLPGGASAVLFRIYTYESLTPQQFSFNWSYVEDGSLDYTTIVGPRFVLDGNMVYFYVNNLYNDKNGVNHTFDLVSKKLSKLSLMPDEAFDEMHITDKYLITQSTLDFFFYDKNTLEFLHNIKTTRERYVDSKFVYGYQNRFVFMDNYFIQICAIVEDVLIYHLMSFDGKKHTRRVRIDVAPIENVDFMTLLVVEKNCIWFKCNDNNLFKVYF